MSKLNEIQRTHYTTKETAFFAGKSMADVRNAIHTGKITAVKHRGRYFISSKDLEKLKN
jgi:hypothetical protein